MRARVWHKSVRTVGGQFTSIPGELTIAPSSPAVPTTPRQAMTAATVTRLLVNMILWRKRGLGGRVGLRPCMTRDWHVRIARAHLMPVQQRWARQRKQYSFLLELCIDKGRYYFYFGRKQTETIYLALLCLAGKGQGLGDKAERGVNKRDVFYCHASDPSCPANLHILIQASVESTFNLRLLQL